MEIGGADLHKFAITRIDLAGHQREPQTIYPSMADEPADFEAKAAARVRSGGLTDKGKVLREDLQSETKRVVTAALSMLVIAGIICAGVSQWGKIENIGRGVSGTLGAVQFQVPDWVPGVGGRGVGVNPEITQANKMMLIKSLGENSPSGFTLLVQQRLKPKYDEHGSLIYKPENYDAWKSVFDQMQKGEEGAKSLETIVDPDDTAAAQLKAYETYLSENKSNFQTGDFFTRLYATANQKLPRENQFTPAELDYLKGKFQMDKKGEGLNPLVAFLVESKGFTGSQIKIIIDIFYPQYEFP